MTRITQPYPLLFLCIACIAIQLFTIRVSHALESIGVLSTVIGNVKINRSGVIISAISADKVFENDKIMTFGKSRAQILLLDQTAINISQNAELILDQFAFGGKEETVALKVTKGTFRFISGKVATKSPEKVNVETPVATIGVRGTEFIGSISQSESLVALFNGKIEVANDAYAQQVTVPGYAVSIDPSGLISPPIKLPQEQLDTLLDSVSTRDEVLDSETIDSDVSEGEDGESDGNEPEEEGGPGPSSDGETVGDQSGESDDTDTDSPEAGDEQFNDNDQPIDEAPSASADQTGGNQPREEPRGDVFGVDLDVAAEYTDQFNDGGFSDSGDYGDYSLESKIFSSSLVQLELRYQDTFGDSRYAVAGGDLESDVSRNELLSEINLFDSAARLQAVGIENEIFFQVREFVVFDTGPQDAALANNQNIGSGTLAFSTGSFFTVPENTSNSTFASVAGTTGETLFQFDPEFSGTDDRELFDLNASTGEFRFINPPDFEKPLDIDTNNIYNFRLLVTDQINTLQGLKTIAVENLGAPDFDGVDPTVQLVSAENLNPLLFSDWADWFVIAQDGNFTWLKDTSALSSVCNASSGACLKLDQILYTYNTNTDRVSISVDGSFTGISVVGTQKNGSFSADFTNHDLDKFVQNSDPGTIAFTTGSASTGFATADADDTITILDASGNNIEDGVTLTVATSFNQTSRDGFNTLTYASLGLNGTNASNNLVVGTDLFVEIGRPGVSGDENKAPFVISATTSPSLAENFLTPVTLNFGDFDADSVSVSFDSATAGTDDRDLFQLTRNDTASCLNQPRDNCFFITPISPLDFETPTDSNTDNTYVLNIQFADAEFTDVVEFRINVLNTLIRNDAFVGNFGEFTASKNLIADTWDGAVGLLPGDGVFTWDLNTTSLGASCANVTQCISISSFDAQYNAMFDTVTVKATGTFTNVPSLGTVTDGTFDIVFDKRLISDFASGTPNTPGQFLLATNSNISGVSQDSDDVSVIRNLSGDDLSSRIGFQLGFFTQDLSASSQISQVGFSSIFGTDSSGNFTEIVSPVEFILGLPARVRNRSVNFANGSVSPDGLNINENASSVTVASEVNINAVSFALDTSKASQDDQDLFRIDNQTGELTFINPPDFETPLDRDTNNAYLVQIQITDGVDTVSGQQTVTVQNLLNTSPAIYTNQVRDFTAEVNTVVDQWEELFTTIQDGVLTWDPDLSSLAAVCLEVTRCVDVDRFFFSYSANTQRATLHTRGTFTDVPVSGVDTNGNFDVVFSDRSAQEFINIQTPSTFAFSTKNLGASNVVTPDSDDIVSITNSVGSDISNDVTIITSSHTNTPTSAGFLATQVGTVTVQGTLANSSSSSSVTNSVEVGQPVVTDAAVVLERGS